MKLGTPKEVAQKFARDQKLMRRLWNGSSATGAVKADSTRQAGSSTSAVAPTGPTQRVSGDTNALYKELSTKLAWSVGSTFGLDYGRRSRIHQWAQARAQALVEAYSRLPNSEKAGL